MEQEVEHPEEDVTHVAGTGTEAVAESDVQGQADAETVNIGQSGAQVVTADKVVVEQGAVGRAEGRFIDVESGAIGIAQGENISVSDGAVGIVAAEKVKIRDSVALMVACNKIEGEDVTVVFNMRAAVVFALLLGVINSLFKLIARRRA